MVNLNNSERALYSFIKRKGEVTIDQLVAFFYKGRKKPKHANGSMAAMMRTLILKCKATRIKGIKRSSSLGRGSTATYKMRK